MLETLLLAALVAAPVGSASLFLPSGRRTRAAGAWSTTRRFVLVPLLELDPDLTLPTGERLADTLQQLAPGQAVRLVSPPLV